VININKTTQNLLAEGFAETGDKAGAAARWIMRRWAGSRYRQQSLDYRAAE
jgi:hypothetical protein